MINSSIWNVEESLVNKLESFRLNKAIKKICRKNGVNPKLRELFISIPKDILKQVNDYNLRNDEKQIPELLYPRLIIKMLYEVICEFPFVVLLELNRCVTSLIRQVVELYIVTLYCRLKPELKKTLTNNPLQRFSNKRGIIKELQDASMNIDYTHETNKDFLECVLSDFKSFSDKFHPATMSFAESILTLTKKGDMLVAELYITSNSSTKDDRVLFFHKKTPIDKSQIRQLITHFYGYCFFVLQEINLINENGAESTG